MEYVRIFALVAALVLTIACLNFINLTTAQSAKRAREVGVRKVLGANRSALIRQFIGESTLLVVLALSLAFLLLQGMLPSFNALTEKRIQIQLDSLLFWEMMLGVTLFTGLLASLYPAFFLSSFRPVAVLKGVMVKSGRAGGLRQLLVVFQEEAVRVMGLKNPIGEELTLWGRTGKVIGVARNFHFVSLRSSIGPLVIHCNPGNTHLYYVKARAGQTLSVIKGLQRIHKKYSSYPFELHFLDQTLERQYRSEMVMQQLSGLFGGLAIFIACLGLFGLAAFTTEQRTKEIGIRKVLGASVSNIVSLLSKDFLKLVLIANVIAWPLAWWAMRQWLQDFAYRVELGWEIFALAGVAALLIALLTVSYQAIKAAMANPVKSLRTE